MSLFATLFAVLALLVPASAAPPQSPGKALRSASKAALSDAKSASKATLSELDDTLDAIVDAYATGLPAVSAVSASVDAVADQRIAFEDAVVASCESLSSDGASILASLSVGDDPVGPGGGPFMFDFMAGGGGVWDRHVARLDRELERHGVKLAKRFAKHLDTLEKVSVDVGDPLAITSRLPVLGAVHAAVEPPILPGALPATTRPARIVAMVRALSASGDDMLVFGVNAPGSGYGFRVSVSGGETFDVTGATPTEATFPVIFGLSEIFAVEMLVATVELDRDAGEASHAQTLGKPLLDAPQSKTLSKTVAKASRGAMRDVRKSAGSAKKALRGQLVDAASSLEAEDVTPAEALAVAFEALVDARDSYNHDREVAGAIMTAAVYAALDDSGLTELPDDLRLGGRGRYAKVADTLRRLDVRAQQHLTKLFERFVKVLRKQAPKVDDTFFVTAVIGRTIPPDLSQLSPLGTGSYVQKRVRVHVPDVVMAQWLVDGELQFDAHVGGVDDPMSFEDVDVSLSDPAATDVAATIEPGPGGVGWASPTLDPAGVYAVLAGPNAALASHWITINAPSAGLD